MLNNIPAFELALQDQEYLVELTEPFPIPLAGEVDYVILNQNLIRKYKLELLNYSKSIK